MTHLPKIAVASAELFNGVLGVAAEANRDNESSQLWGQTLGNIAVQVAQHFTGHSKTLDIRPTLPTRYGRSSAWARFPHASEAQLQYGEPLPELSGAEVAATYGKLNIPGGEVVGLFRYPLVEGDVQTDADFRAASMLAASARAALRIGDVKYNELGYIKLKNDRIAASVWFPHEDPEIVTLRPRDDTHLNRVPREPSKNGNVIDITARLRRRGGAPPTPPDFNPAS